MPTPSKPSPCVGIRTCSDYSPFGVELDGRTVSGGYRFGFNTQEKTDEISGSGNHTAALYWEYDSRLGRRWNIDPVFKPFESPISCFGGNPILNVDPSGDDWFVNVRTGNVVFVKNESKMTQNALDQLQSPYNIEDYQRLGTDKMFGDKVINGDSKENVLDKQVALIKDPENFMKDHGFEKARQLQIETTTLIDKSPEDFGFNIETTHEEKKLLFSRIIYVKPELLNSKEVLSSIKKEIVTGVLTKTIEISKVIVPYNYKVNSSSRSNDSWKGLTKFIGEKGIETIKKTLKK